MVANWKPDYASENEDLALKLEFAVLRRLLVEHGELNIINVIKGMLQAVVDKSLAEGQIALHEEYKQRVAMLEAFVALYAKVFHLEKKKSEENIDEKG